MPALRFLLRGVYSVGKPYKHIPKKGVVMLESSTTSNNPENKDNDVNVGDDRMMLVTASLIEKFNPPKLNLHNSFILLADEGKLVNMIDEFTEACGTHNVGDGETKTVTLSDVIQRRKRLEEVAMQYPSDNEYS